MRSNGGDPLWPLIEALAEQLAPLVADLVAERLVVVAQPEEPWRLLSVAEAGKCLGRSPKWIREHKDEIGWVKLDGGAFAFLIEDLQAYARARRVPEHRN